MIRGQGNCRTSGDVVVEDLRTMMNRFDTLPKALREVLRNSIEDWSHKGVPTLLYRKKVPLEVLVDAYRKHDVKASREFIEASFGSDAMKYFYP